MTFTDLGLHQNILRAVDSLGFSTPSEIQEKAIPIISSGTRDFVGLAQTGTGKTAAFGLPLIQQTDFQNNETQGLVICPTRELCMQITKDLTAFARYQPNPNIVPVYGGASIDEQIRRVKKGAHIVVATPGRLLDLIRRNAIRLDKVRRLVLDEADEMLNMGFKEDIDAILEQTPEDKKVWLFSATMPPEVRRIAKNYMKDPSEIIIGTKNSTAENIEHRYYMMREKDRYYALKRILDFYPDIYGLVFCRTKRETGMISEKLEKEGYNVVALHGDLSQAQRDAAMRKFRERTATILVATDVAARGLDVDGITHVIQYNLPDETENYTHRSGRTARAGKSGISATLINTREIHKIKQIEKHIRTRIEYTPIPDAEEIGEKQMLAMIEKVANTPVNEEAIDRYWPVIYKKLKNLPAEEIVLKFISAELNSLLDYYKNAGDLNAASDNRGSEKRKGRSEKVNRNKKSYGPTVSFYINLGVNQNLNKGALVRLICNGTGIPSSQMGKIDIRAKHAIFEIDEEAAPYILPRFETGLYEGKTFRIKHSGEKNGKRKQRSRANY